MGGQLPNTIGLVGDGDDADLIRDIEAAFDFTIANKDAERLETVGDLYDLILRQLVSRGDARGCASAMAFYRLRRALGGIDPAIRVRPETPLTVFDSISVKKLFDTLEYATGLRLPQRPLSRAGCVNLLAAVVAFFSAAVLFPQVLGVNLFTLAALGFALLLIGKLDPGTLPQDCVTVADLSRQTARRSYGCLLRLGAKARETEIWDALVTLLSDLGNVPSESVHRDTILLNSVFRERNAA